jgi:hypothetical protein
MKIPGVSQVSRRKSLIAALSAVTLMWIAGIASGMEILWRYASKPGAKAAMLGFWPASTSIERDPDRFTLLMFAHPRCSCTRASLEELASIRTKTGGRLAVRILFFKPEGFSDDWTNTDLWTNAASLPGVQIARDAAGAEASRFGAATSGQVFVYEPDGKLVFSGGITGARGHAGENDGRFGVIEHVTAGSSQISQTPVYGCPLLSESFECEICLKQK